MTKISFKSLCAGLIMSLICGQTGALAQSAAVPSQYTTEYADLEQVIDSFITTLSSQPPTHATPPIGTGLDTADGGNGLSLLQANALTNVKTELNRYQQLGVKTVQISMGFPICCQEFWTQKMQAPGDQSQIISFYQQTVALCHQAGMKVVAETHPLYPSSDNFGQSAGSFSTSLSAAQFQQYMSEHVGNVAKYIRPDVISIVAEPNTDAAWTNQSVYNTASALAAFVQAITNTITQANAAESTHIVAAAGAPSWMTYAQNYDNQLYGVSGLGAIDIHTYFVGANDLQTATSLATNAKAAGKNVIVSECWLSKYGTNMPPSRPGADQPTNDRAIDSYSFWQPLDEKWISAMSQWASQNEVSEFCFSYPQQLFAYLNYNSVSSQPPLQIFQDEKQAMQQAMNAGQLSPVGQKYPQLVGSY